MNLRLSNRYPFPYPADVSEAEAERISSDAGNHELILSGVKHYETKHTVTVEFKDLKSYEAAEAATGWKVWGTSDSDLILEAQVSAADGYGPFPAIVAGGYTWCGIVLTPEKITETVVTSE